MMGGMTRLVLVRHGQTDWNREGRWQGHADPGLNDLGWRQADAAAARLAREYAGSPVVTSDLRRAAQTASRAAAALGVEPTVDVRLREVDVGEWSGLTRDQVRERDQDGYLAWEQGRNHGYPGGETFAELTARATAAMHELFERHAGGTVVAVCHGGTIRSMVASALSIGDAGRRLLATGANGSLSVLDTRRGGGIGLVSLNDAGHLAADLH
jgi:glucosyl-3-phosphoglycerate phosphatase